MPPLRGQEGAAPAQPAVALDPRPLTWLPHRTTSDGSPSTSELPDACGTRWPEQPADGAPGPPIRRRRIVHGDPPASGQARRRAPPIMGRWQPPVSPSATCASPRLRAREYSAARPRRGDRPCSTGRRGPCHWPLALRGWCTRRNRGKPLVARLDLARLLAGRVAEVRLDRGRRPPRMSGDLPYREALELAVMLGQGDRLVALDNPIATRGWRPARHSTVGRDADAPANSAGGWWVQARAVTRSRALLMSCASSSVRSLR